MRTPCPLLHRSHPALPSSGFRSGFTLIELLIVIVIIAVLASAVFVGGRAVMDQARVATVVTNARTIAQAYSGVVSERGNMPAASDPGTEGSDDLQPAELVCQFMDPEGRPLATEVWRVEGTDAYARYGQGVVEWQPDAADMQVMGSVPSIGGGNGYSPIPVVFPAPQNGNYSFEPQSPDVIEGMIVFADRYLKGKAVVGFLDGTVKTFDNVSDEWTNPETGWEEIYPQDPLDQLDAADSAG